MTSWIDRFPAPPPISPSARPALGVALCLNVLLAAGIHLGVSFAVSTKVDDDLSQTLMQAAPIIYLVLLLPVLGIYGIAAAAWTGWSWWRVPLATLAGAALALGVNAWAMAQWIARQGWPVGEILSKSDPRVWSLVLLSGASLAALLLIALTMFKRWE